MESRGFSGAGACGVVQTLPLVTGFGRRSHEQAYLLANSAPRLPQVFLLSVLEWRYTENRLHPTQKPVGALMPLVMALFELRDIVLKPFAGSRSTAVAAQILGRRFIAIELSAQYALRHMTGCAAGNMARSRQRPS